MAPNKKALQLRHQRQTAAEAREPLDLNLLDLQTEQLTTKAAEDWHRKMVDAIDERARHREACIPQPGARCVRRQEGNKCALLEHNDQQLRREAQ